MRRTIPAAFLLFEGVSGAVWVAGLISMLQAYGVLTAVLVVARGLAGALQCAGGVMLLTRRPPGQVFGQLGFASGAVLATLETGFRFVPTNSFPTYRWVWVAIYWVYALGMIALLRRLAAHDEA